MTIGVIDVTLSIARAALILAGAALLVACSTASRPEMAIAATPWAQASSVRLHGGLPGEDWQHYRLPGKEAVDFRAARLEGRDALAATAVSAASVVRHRVRVEPGQLGGLKFSWKVPHLITGADMALRDGDDSPVRVILAFEGDRSRFSARDALLAELTRTLTGEDMPYATLMYVWCNERSTGSIIRNPRTDRIRKLVLESGPENLDRWLDYERDIRADFQRAFGEPPGALVGIAIMTDSDNTRSTAQAWYGPLSLVAPTAPAR